jgi:hypothetical protein
MLQRKLQRSLTHPTVRRILAVTVILAVLVHGTIVIFLRPPHQRDFDLHRVIGTWFLNQDNLYGCGVCYPYMPIGAMYFSLLALVSRSVGFALRYVAAIGCLWLTCVLVHRMMRERFHELAQATLALSVMTLVMAGQFILYDLDDGGPHAILMGMMVGGLYAVWTGREKLGALWLGLAIALKVTPALFLPFFLWKRQWRLAFYTATAMTAWILLPMVWMGPSSWWTHQVTWTKVTAGSMVGMETAYTRMNEDNVRNSGMNPALMRYLVTLPQDDPLRVNDPGYVPILNVATAHARMLVIAAIVSLLGVFAWHTRHPYQGPGDAEWPRESAMVMMLMLFLSPLTWIQHLPWLVPALYWIAARACSDGGLPVLSKFGLGLYVMIAVVLTYEVLGKQHYTVFLSYKPFTIGMLVLFSILISRPKEMSLRSYSAAWPLADAQ